MARGGRGLCVRRVSWSGLGTAWPVGVGVHVFAAFSGSGRGTA